MSQPNEDKRGVDCSRRKEAISVSRPYNPQKVSRVTAFSLNTFNIVSLLTAPSPRNHGSMEAAPIISFIRYEEKRHYR